MTIAECAAEIRKLCDADSTSYADVDLLRRFNSAQEEFGVHISLAVGKAQFDDRNYASLPVGTIDLSEGVAKYTIADLFLGYDRFSVLDKDGNLQRLLNIDPNDFRDSEIEEAFEATGLPTHIDKLENTITLYPAPTATAVTLTGGLKFRMNRTTYTISSAELTTGTIVPGIASPFHDTLCHMTALPYCKTYKPERVTQLERDIAAGLDLGVKWYSMRDRTEPEKMTMAGVNHR